MAWARTSLSMISFGFTIYKFLEVIQQQSSVPAVPPETPRDVGLTLITIGTFALIGACVQHVSYMRKLSRLNLDQPYKPVNLTFIVACLVGLLGLLMFGSIILRIGPLG